MKLSLPLLSLMLLASFTSVARAADTEVKRPDLTGAVKNKEGQPIAGASAFIYTAGPKLGVGFL